MGELFGRSYKLTVSLLGIPGFMIDSSISDPPLDIAFNVVRTLTREPNTANITVFNLSPVNRSNLEVLEDAQVELEAGYGNKNGLIFKGDCEVNNVHTFPDWQSVFEADDGGKAIRFDRVNLSFAPGTTLATVINKVAAEARVGIGNAALAALQGNLVDSGGKSFLNGITVSGNLAKQMNRLTKSSGLEWSIQNDTLQLLVNGQPLPQEAVLLNSDTGLVGAPSVGNKGEVTFRSLLNKDIVPGGLVQLASQKLTGLFVCRKCTYIGASLGQDWYVDVEAKAL
jgi:hypothetical protein